MFLLEKHQGKIILIYLGSLFLSGSFSKIPYVLDVIDIAVLGSLGAWIAYLLITLSKESMRFSVLLAHVIVGVLLHPAVTIKEEAIPNTEAQIENLIKLHRPDNELTDRLGLALDLSKMIRDEAVFAAKHSDSMLYWAYPISVVLCLWGAIFFVLLSKSFSERQ